MEDPNDTIDPHAGDNDLPVVAGAPGGTGTPAGGTPDYEASADGNIVKGRDGKTYYREEALHAERTKAQNYAKTLASLEPLMPEFEEFLARKQGGRNATVERATRSVDNGDYSEDELNGYAITRGYYDGENKPDLRRAKDDLDIMTAIADRRAGRAVRPIAESGARDKASRNVERALSQTFIDGEPLAEEKYVRAAFDAIPDSMKADDGISQVMQVVAVGLQALDDRRSGRVRGRGGREPVFREGGGSPRTSNEGTLDALDRAAARARGKSPDQWAKMTKAVGGTSFGGTVLDEV